MQPLASIRSCEVGILLLLLMDGFFGSGAMLAYHSRQIQ
jgi:hypothetical protein